LKWSALSLFVSVLVSWRQHRMASYTIQTMATLGAYSHANLVPSGVLDAAHKKACEEAQAKARARAAEEKAQAAVAKAEVIAAEETLTEGSGDEDDEDVLGPSSDAEEEVGGGVSSDDE
ncbi:hypothetical protein FRC11_014578, partial [Ceratobasidium sp. 423]